MQLARATGSMDGKQHAYGHSWHRNGGRHVLVGEGHLFASLVHVTYIQISDICDFNPATPKAECPHHLSHYNISFANLHQLNL